MKKCLYILLSVALVFTSCVSKKKFLYEQERVRNLQSDSIGTHTSLNECKSSLDYCYTEAAKMEKEKTETEKTLSALSSSSQTTIEISKMTIADQAKRLLNMQKIINAQRDIMSNLKKTVADALVGFTPEELSVEIKNGNIYVSLQEKLLFKSGSDQVDPKGREALQKLAPVLNNNPDINVNIEGHTDSIPIKGKFADNWALSVSRATSIVRILTIDYGVDSHRVIASGRGEYFPVAVNSLDEGRSRNRRTEIILSPNLTELFKLLNQ
jgi:chemotaxis protein MotB